MNLLLSSAFSYMNVDLSLYTVLNNDCLIIINSDWFKLYVFESIELEGGKTFTTVMFVMYVYQFP